MDNEPIEGADYVEVLPQMDGVTHTPSIAKLTEALAKAQLKFQPVLKQNENEAFRRGQKVSKYADLATYIDATQKALAEEGLVVMAWPDVSPEAKSMSLLTILSHSSGEWMKGKLTLPALGRDGFTAQSCGSSITYARRYVYAAILGVASEDDDGNAGSGRGTAEAAKEVAETKIADLKAKKGGKEPVSALFYAWSDASQTAEITGAEDLMHINRDLLKPHWNAVAKAVIVNADELEGLKFQLEQRNCPFKQLKAAS